MENKKMVINQFWCVVPGLTQFSFLYHIHTTWIWYLVLTQPIAGRPEAIGFARISPKLVRKRLTFSQYSIFIVICLRQKHIKVSRWSFTLVDLWAFLPNFTSSLLLR
jgi:hypothetical protein